MGRNDTERCGGRSGESLTNLIRLRDTISYDAKIDKLLAHVSEQERVLRHLQIERMKMERANSDSRFRTQLCLLQSRIQLQEQELQHLQSEIGAAESRVNSVWKEVLRPPKRANTHSPSSQQPAVEAELASVLGRFECFVARLQRKHELEAKAAALLAKPWKQQMEELQLRMVIRLQRAYRARRAAREAKAQALEKVRDQRRERARKQQHEQLERVRMQALREKEQQRHQTRLHAKQAEEEQARARLASRERALIRKMRDEEIAQRTATRDRQTRERAFAVWRSFVARRRQKWRANKLFMKFTFLKWKLRFAAAKQRERAAQRIQLCVRSHRARAAFRRALNLRVKRSRLAAKYLAKVQQRRVNALFLHWCSFAAYRQTLRANLQEMLQKRVATWFSRWLAFVELWKATTVAAASLIQRVYRGRIARQVLRYQRRRHQSALVIQRVYRGHTSRVAARLLRQMRTLQSAHCAALLQRIRLRAAHACYCRLQLNAVWERTIKRMAMRRHAQDQLRGFSCWVAFVVRRREKRAAFLRRQYDSAVLIQRNFRRHRCQTRFFESVRRHRAAIAIQRVVRGSQGRARAKQRWWERRAATLLQTAWRQRRAKQLADALRAAKILLGAFKGDYSSTQRAIAAGYGHVVDAEHNGILHMAAAAGHKRLVKLCLRHQFDVNAVNHRQQTPLHLLLANLPPVSVADSDDVQQQQQQERADKVALAAYMVDHGAWHEAPDEDGFTPLLLCSVLGHTDTVEMLLEREANTDARTLSGGLNAAQLATEGNHWRTLQALLASRGFDFDANARDTVQLLHACAGRGFLDSLRVLVAHIRERFDTFPADVLDTADDDGYTPLIYAITNGFVDIVQCLLESDAAPDVKDYFGRSPLHFAVTHDDDAHSEAVVKLLTMYDADVNVKDNDGDAPLHLSCDRDARLASTSLLLAHGATICANALGNHPTHIAARYGAVATLELLVQYGGDMNLKNYEGKTPLGMARMFGQKRVVQHIAHLFAQESLAADEEPADPDERLSQADESSGVLLVDTVGVEGDDGEVKEPEVSDVDGHLDGQQLPRHQRLRPLVMTASDWQDALAGGYWMGAIAEWTQYIDTTSDTPFYLTGDENEVVCTWDAPAEFEAAMGEEWEIVKSDGGEPMRRLSELADGESDEPMDAAGRQYLYHNKLSGEVRASVPPVNYALLQDVVQNSRRQKQLRARVHKVAAADTSASAVEYMRFVRAFEAESAQARAEIRAATTIQRHFRARQTLKRLKALLHENRSALQVQRAFRGRKARRLAVSKRKEYAAAARIQAVWRGFAVRKQEGHGGRRAQRVAHLRRREAAVTIQRLFRGWCGRRAWYREKVVSVLGPKGYVEWEQLRKRAVVKRSYKVWDELLAPRDFPGVRFYCHQVTRVCSWTQPNEWVAQDRAAFEERCQLFRWGYTQPMRLAAIRLQRLWRARTARISFQAILRAVRLMQTCEQEYLEDPTNLVKMGNYVLYLHTIKHDYERARPLYGRLMRTMAQRGPDLSFVLFSYGIFLHVTQEEDAAIVEEMIVRGKAVDPQLRKYKMAFLGFFRQALVQNPLDAESNLNYAACAQWLYEQYDEAAKHYVRAIAANPRKKGSMQLFQEMLNRKRQVDRLKHKHKQSGGGQQPLRDLTDAEDESRAQYDGFEIFRRWQAKQAEEEDCERRRALQADADKHERETAARKLQARYRRRLAMRTTNRLQLERRMGESIAALAKQKAVYDKVVAAFEAVAITEKPASKGAAASSAKTRPLSVPVSQLSALLRGLGVGLSDAQVQSLTSSFRETHPRLQHVNVMDMCAFVEASEVLQTAA